VEMQPVGDDVAFGSERSVEAERVDDEILAGARVGDVGDLGRLRVDQLSEEFLGMRPRGVTATGAIARLGEAIALVEVRAHRVGRGPRHWMRVGRVEKGVAVAEVEVTFARKL